MDSRIEREFELYARWRERLRSAIADYRAWLDKHELSDAQTDHRLDDLLATLADNRLYIAFVAEYSRGKSELINAIFFADFGQRVLPSSAGRTTMCPTELAYDPAQPPSIRLLPIETRTTGTTVAEYKGFPEEWHTIRLDTDNAKQVAEALQHISEIKTVTPTEAQAMGLHIAQDEAHEDGMHLTEDGMVEIPAWRHAIINFPHPLLEQGLVILDTPGLNALGAEPELTFNLLSTAHAVLFVLATDTGVTKSDMAVWRDHINNTEGGTAKGILVVLNKIDVLWDELRDWDEVQKEIERQTTDTAKTLGVPESNIFALSAQKALLGKVKGDRELIEQSRILALEETLANTIIPSKRDIVRDHVATDIRETAKTVRALVQQRLDGVKDHIAELETLNSQNIEVIEDMMNKVKADKAHLERSLQRFQATRSIFSQQTNRLYSHLNLKRLNSLIAETKKNMAVSMTTAGLRASMGRYFERARRALEQAGAQAREIRALMEGMYQKFQEEHGMARVRPGGFSTTRYLRELRALEARHNQILGGMSLVMTEQMAVVRTFLDSVAAKVRDIFERANREADGWLKTIMSPMEAQVREHQVQLRRRLESIKRIHKASESLDERLAELQHVREGFTAQANAADEMIERIIKCLDSEPAGAAEQKTA